MKRLYLYLFLVVISGGIVHGAIPGTDAFLTNNFKWTGKKMELQDNQNLGSLSTSNQFGLTVTKPAGQTSFVYIAQLDVDKLWIDARNRGAIVDGFHDDSDALQAAVNDVQAAGGGTVMVPEGLLRITKPILVTGQNVNILGSSKGSFILADLAAPGAAIKVANGANIVFKGSIRNLGFQCVANGIDKTAIELDDTSDYTVSDIDIYPWTGGGTNNVGILTRGRQFIYVERCTVIADRPIVIGTNPNSYLSFDQSHVRDVGLESNKGGPSIFVEDGVFFSDSVFDGNQSWNKGVYGFYWKNTTSGLRSLKLKIANARPEQSPDASGYAIFLDATAGAVQGVTIENCSFPDDMPGLYMRNCQGVSLVGDQFYENGFGGITEQANFTVVDSTNYCERVKFENCFSQSGGTAVTTGMTLVQRDWKSMGGNPLPESGLYLKLANNRYQVNSPLFLGASDSYAEDTINNAVSPAMSLHHSNSGAAPVFGIGTGLDFYSDTATTHDIWASTFQTVIVNPLNSFDQLWILNAGSRFLEADFASDHITFYPAVFNVPNVNVSSGIITPAIQVTGQTASTLVKLSGSQALTSIPNSIGVAINDGAGNISWDAGLTQTSVIEDHGATNWTFTIVNGRITSLTHSP